MPPSSPTVWRKEELTISYYNYIIKTPNFLELWPSSLLLRVTHFEGNSWLCSNIPVLQHLRTIQLEPPLYSCSSNGAAHSIPVQTAATHQRCSHLLSSHTVFQGTADYCKTKHCQSHRYPTGQEQLYKHISVCSELRTHWEQWEEPQPNPPESCCLHKQFPDMRLLVYKPLINLSRKPLLAKLICENLLRWFESLDKEKQYHDLQMMAIKKN